MQKKQSLTIAALCLASVAMAQEPNTKADSVDVAAHDDAAFTFTEAQLGEDDDMSTNVTIINSGSNLYASQVGYAFSATRFRYRALNQKFNDVYINGMQMNDMETGQFRYSLIGGLNNQTRNVEFSLPFEDNQFGLTNMAGSNNYNFRAGSMATGHKASLLFANRNYQLRAMYTYNSGFNKNGWAFSASLTYRGATYDTQKWNQAYKGTFYNALSYYLAVEKILGDHHLSFAAWGNPTERAATGASTDEMYWLANNNYYNPYWGYQNGKIRNSRVVTDFAPSGLFTWDWKISDKAKLTTTLGGRYSMYKSTKLNYNNSDNPQPDYWKSLPSNQLDVWSGGPYTQTEVDAWQAAVNYFQSSEENRQINWDKLYYSNANLPEGKNAMYYIQAKRNDALTLQLNSVLNIDLKKNDHLSIGLGMGLNHGRHYQTLEDLLGAKQFQNINTYCIGDYPTTANEIQYDLNNPNQIVKTGDVFGYDYYINVHKVNPWIAYSRNFKHTHFFIGGKMGYTDMQRDGRMRNGLAPNNSYGKSGIATFIDAGAKAGLYWDLGKGNTLNFGFGYESRAPQASTAFIAPEINNDFVTNLRNEHVLSAEVGYQLKSKWVSLNVNGYYSRIEHATEWQCFYYDNVNSFTYVSMTGINKEAYGVEAGAKVRITSFLDFKALGTYSEAKYISNADASYMYSNSGAVAKDVVYSNGMRESGTPLTATSLGLSFHMNGWYIDAAAKYYDRIYLSWSPCMRYHEYIKATANNGQGLKDVSGFDAQGNAFSRTADEQVADHVPEQAQGNGGWMVDASIGKNIYLKKGSLSINLSLTNILNNIKICTGGYEQSRSNYTFKTTKDEKGIISSTTNNTRTYNFANNPKKYYAYGINGMLNITYKF